MKNTLLSAAVAALWFAGCDQLPTSKSAPARVEPKPPVVVMGTIDLTAIDGGQLTQAAPEPPKDMLALEHDQPKVDHLERARQLKGEGDWGAALTEARRALHNDAENEEVLDFIARIAPRTGQHAMSAEAFGRLSLLRPDDAIPVIGQTRALINAKDYKAAIATGREAIARDEQNVEGWHALGRAYLSSGDLQSAIIAFEKAIEIAPHHGYSLNNLGLAYLRAYENDAAVQVLERAVEELPHVAYVQNNLGVAYERVGRKIEAKEAYSRAIALSPRYVKAKLNSDRVAKLSPEVLEEQPEVTPEDAQAVPENTVP
jgi:tetratricopeptide (TPR) repeat protein